MSRAQLATIVICVAIIVILTIVNARHIRRYPFRWSNRRNRD